MPAGQATASLCRPGTPQISCALAGTKWLTFGRDLRADAFFSGAMGPVVMYNASVTGKWLSVMLMPLLWSGRARWHQLRMLCGAFTAAEVPAPTRAAYRLQCAT